MKYVWSSHFPEAITTNMLIGNDSFVFKYAVTGKKNFKIHITFIEIKKRLSFMCSPRNDKCNRLYSKTNLSIKSLLRTSFLCFSWFFFAFWEIEKHFIHIAPFRSTSYVLMRLRWLEVSNCLRNWNKDKTSFSWSRNFNYANWKYQFNIQIKVSEFINKLVSFLFCEFNRVTSWNEGKNIILVRSSFQIPK